MSAVSGAVRCRDGTPTRAVLEVHGCTPGCKGGAQLLDARAGSVSVVSVPRPANWTERLGVSIQMDRRSHPMCPSRPPEHGSGASTRVTVHHLQVCPSQCIQEPTVIPSPSSAAQYNTATWNGTTRSQPCYLTKGKAARLDPYINLPPRQPSASLIRAHHR